MPASRTPPQEQENYRVCGARNRDGSACAQPAMSNGKCKMHGGLSTGKTPLHGRRSRENGPARIRLSERAAKFAQLTDPLDLSMELAFMRALWSEWIEHNDERNLEPYERAEALQIISETGKLIERIERIRNATALTQAEVQYLQARMADIMLEFVPDPQMRAAFIAKLRAATGSHHEEPPRAPVCLPQPTYPDTERRTGSADRRTYKR